MPPTKHALLGPSSAARWLHCPPSARLTENMPDTGSPYANAGTLAHEIAELKARNYFLEPLPKRTYNSRLKKLQADPAYDKGMDGNTDDYLEHLKARAMSYDAPPNVFVEWPVDFSDIVPEGKGTLDCGMIGGDCADIIDYKNGSGVPVEPEKNPQMMLYAWGLIREFSMIYGDTIKRVHISIVQPNAGGVKEWETTVAYLQEWAYTYVRERAWLAWEGKGEFDPGDWCRFCKAKATCSARAAYMLQLEPMVGCIPEKSAGPGTLVPQEFSHLDKDGNEIRALLSDAEVGDVLTRARNIAAWVKDLETYALTAALEGRKIDGWKAVEGRGSREWVGGTDKAFPALEAHGIDTALLWERKPVTVAALEKALGKKTFSEAAEGLWAKSPGKPTLVPETDRREPYNAAAAAFEKVE